MQQTTKQSYKKNCFTNWKAYVRPTSKTEIPRQSESGPANVRRICVEILAGPDCYICYPSHYYDTINKTKRQEKSALYFTGLPNFMNPSKNYHIFWLALTKNRLILPGLLFHMKLIPIFICFTWNIWICSALCQIYMFHMKHIYLRTIFFSF